MPIYMIYSGMSLGAIREFISAYGPVDKVGQLRVSYDKDGYETDRTIALMDKSVYDALVGAGFNKRKPGIDFAISEYHLSQKIQPDDKHTANFYIPVPKSLKLSEQQVLAHVGGRLSKMVEFGDLAEKSYRLTIPMVSRESGELKGSCYVSFRRDTPIEAIAKAKVVIDGSTWIGGSGECRCFWVLKRDKVEVKEQPKAREV